MATTRTFASHCPGNHDPAQGGSPVKFGMVYELIAQRPVADPISGANP
jgi:hypothetical protein